MSPSKIVSACRRLLQTEQSYVLVVLRVALAIVVFPHGAQKLLGWFGGPGVDGTMQLFAALEEIVDQSEGAQLEIWDGDIDVLHPEPEQVAHYFRFQELKLGRRYQRGDTPQSGPTGETITVDWDGVRPMRANPRSSDHAPGSPIRTAQEAFSRTYCALLQQLDRAFNGSPGVLTPAIGGMYDLKDLAQALMQMPTEDGLTTAGPTFEYVVRA